MDIQAFTKAARHWTPISVSGVARSGTRMISDILNQHPEIEIESEMHAKTLEAYFEFLDRTQANFDHYSERKGFVLDKHWRHTQGALHHLFLATAGKQAAQRPFAKRIRYHGMKTPGYERYFERFEQMFAPVKPLYIYSLRQVGPVWRSWVTREFNAELDVFRRRYERSLRQALKIKQRDPERFAIFDLDAYVAATDKLAFINQTILAKLGIPEDLVWPEDGMPNTNGAAALGLSLQDSDIMAEQMAELAGNECIQLYREKLLA